MPFTFQQILDVLLGQLQMGLNRLFHFGTLFRKHSLIYFIMAIPGFLGKFRDVNQRDTVFERVIAQRLAGTDPIDTTLEDGEPDEGSPSLASARASGPVAQGPVPSERDCLKANLEHGLLH